MGFPIESVSHDALQQVVQGDIPVLSKSFEDF